jgi:DNA modification methylase
MLLLNGDCLEVMKTLPDKSVDLFLCDLPYGCLSANPPVIPNTENKHRKACPPTERKGCAWDIKIDLAQFWVQVKRLCKDDHTPVLMFCSTKFGFDLYNSNPDWFRYDLVWNKMRGVSFLAANKMPMRSHEMIYVFAKKGARYYRKDIEGEFKKSHSRGNAKVLTTNTFNGGQPLPMIEQADNSTTRCVLSVVEANGEGRTRGKHPTQKPDDLYAWLIERYSKEGDTILDPTAGSFASVFTAEKLGRIGIGIEKDVEFYNKAKNVDDQR